MIVCLTERMSAAEPTPEVGVWKIASPVYDYSFKALFGALNGEFEVQGKLPLERAYNEN